MTVLAFRDLRDAREAAQEVAGHAPVDDEIVTCIQCLGREFVARECAQNLTRLRDSLSMKYVVETLFV